MTILISEKIEFKIKNYFKKDKSHYMFLQLLNDQLNMEI